MIRNPIHKALSTILKHEVTALLIGGQACILYGAAEFSRDIDLAVMISPKNLEKLKLALEELDAKNIFVPNISEEVLSRGHACHFRCQREDVQGIRIDVISAMRGLDEFDKLLERREEIKLPTVGKIPVMGLSDLVKAKKTQRDKDWPMIRRLIESDIYKTVANPSTAKLCFWFKECRTPELLISLADKHPDIASEMSESRHLLKHAIEGNLVKTQELLRDEEDRERELDRQYWAPLKAELQTWRFERRKKGKL